MQGFSLFTNTRRTRCKDTRLLEFDDDVTEISSRYDARRITDIADIEIPNEPFPSSPLIF